MYDDLRNCSVLFERCMVRCCWQQLCSFCEHLISQLWRLQDVYRARILNELKLEERLYETIIDIYRRFVRFATHPALHTMLMCELWMRTGPINCSCCASPTSTRGLTST